MSKKSKSKPSPTIKLRVGTKVKILASTHADVQPGAIGKISGHHFQPLLYKRSLVGYFVSIAGKFLSFGKFIDDTREIYFSVEEVEKYKEPRKKKVTINDL